MLLVNKPKGISSFDVIRRLRNIIAIKKIGHAGTLDPLATGLLIILIGGATKKQGRFMKLDKTYEAEITLGAISTTDDAEGAITPVQSSKSKVEKPTRTKIQAVLNQFIGEIKQQPPRFSAVKVGGQRAYKLARKGAEVALPIRNVRIHKIELLGYEFPKLRIMAEVGSGTYIRSLARDIGEKLGTGAFLSSLIRTKIGEFELSEAVEVDKTGKFQIEQKIMPIS